MKNILNPLKLSVSLAALLLSQASFAGGTTAGTVVVNTATISYSVGGAAQSDISSEVADFTVDRKVDLTVTGNSAAHIIVAPSSSRVVSGNALTYVLSNDGNDAQDFKISATHLTTDNYDAGTGTTTAPLAPEACQFSITPSGAGTPSGPHAITATPTVTLAKDETAAIVVSCSMPNRPDVDDGHLSTIDILATAVDSAGATMAESTGADQEDAIDVVLADGVRAGSTTDASARNAMHSDTQTYEIDVPMLTVVKTSKVLEDPLNGTTNPKRIPGAIVEYTITIENSSDSLATGLKVTDVLTAVQDGEVAFNTGSIVNASGAAGTYNATTFTVEATNITVPVATSSTVPGVSVVTFTVTIL